MKYTSGLFSGDESLETGIVKMLDKHVSYLEGYDTPDILEVGQGWGAFLRRLMALNLTVNYTAINPSRTQNDYVLANVDSNALIVNDTFEKHDFGQSKFDAMYFIGSFCHIPNKPLNLRKASSLLRTGGSLIIEDTFFINHNLFALHRNRKETRFVQKDVFGFAEILPFSEFVEIASAAGLQISSVLEHSQSYKKTIHFWLERLRSVETPSARPFVKYLEIAQRGWQHTIANYLIHLVKVPT